MSTFPSSCDSDVRSVCDSVVDTVCTNENTVVTEDVFCEPDIRSDDIDSETSDTEEECCEQEVAIFDKDSDNTDVNYTNTDDNTTLHSSMDSTAGTSGTSARSSVRKSITFTRTRASREVFNDCLPLLEPRIKRQPTRFDAAPPKKTRLRLPITTEFENPNKRWKVEKILGVAHKGGVKYFRVLWADEVLADGTSKSYPSTFEPADIIKKDVPNMVAIFEGKPVRKGLKSGSKNAVLPMDEHLLKSEDAYGSVITDLIIDFTNRGEYSKESGLGWFEDDDDIERNIRVQMNFLHLVFEKWSSLESGVGSHLDHAVGRNTVDKRQLQKYRNQKIPVPFWDYSTARPHLSSLANKTGLVCFLMIGGAAKNNKDDLHCGVGVIEGPKPWNCYYYDTRIEPDNPESLPKDYYLLAKRMSENVPIKIGYGNQSMSMDCAERALHFMAALRDGLDWKSLSSAGWVDYNPNALK